MSAISVPFDKGQQCPAAMAKATTKGKKKKKMKK